MHIIRRIVKTASRQRYGITCFHVQLEHQATSVSPSPSPTGPPSEWQMDMLLLLLLSDDHDRSKVPWAHYLTLYNMLVSLLKSRPRKESRRLIRQFLLHWLDLNKTTTNTYTCVVKIAGPLSRAIKRTRAQLPQLSSSDLNAVDTRGHVRNRVVILVS